MEDASDEADRKRFEEWMKEHNKKYKSSEEMEIRFSAFKSNLRIIEAHYADPKITFPWMGLGLHSDIPFGEFYRGGILPSDSDDDQDEGTGENTNAKK